MCERIIRPHMQSTSATWMQGSCIQILFLSLSVSILRKCSQDKVGDPTLTIQPKYIYKNNSGWGREVSYGFMKVFS